MDNVLFYVVVAVALGFDYTNGFHDAANSIATVVSTRVLTPRNAVIWAAFWNFIAFLVFHTKVANTIAKGIVKPAELDPKTGIVTVGVIFAGLIGAIAWNLLTFYLGLPTSSSHALVGAFAGAAVARAGFDVLLVDKVREIAAFIVLAPLIGLALGLTATLIILWTFRGVKRLHTLNLGFRVGQLVSSAAFSLGHGANDAQKTMGIILALLIVTERAGAHAEVPLWVVLSAHTAIGLGTLSGGWRIVKTMGSKITRLQPVGGFAAESAAATTLFFTAANGIPVSTTHTIAGAIVGVGATQRLSAVRWGVASQVVWAWVLTIPGAFLMAALVSLIVGVFE
ncbi:MAG TPA: inorganic phosphate transporter [Frankiaceae bacterium]|jgi:PiT family inorganic phosphate transporter|nr:inorganic phosphate transporter [Frankiaceae bacterium]